MPFLASKGPMLAMPMARRGQWLRAFNVSIPVKIIWRSCSAPVSRCVLSTNLSSTFPERSPKIT